MKSKKGQALVEFVIILPVTLILLFGIVDFGRIISLKSNLENLATDSVTFYSDGRTLEDIKRLLKLDDNTTITINEQGEYTSIELKKQIKPITPGLSYIAPSVFDVKVTRVTKNE